MWYRDEDWLEEEGRGFPTQWGSRSREFGVAKWARVILWKGMIGDASKTSFSLHMKALFRVINVERSSSNCLESFNWMMGLHPCRRRSAECCFVGGDLGSSWRRPYLTRTGKRQGWLCSSWPSSNQTSRQRQNAPAVTATLPEGRGGGNKSVHGAPF